MSKKIHTNVVYVSLGITSFVIGLLLIPFSLNRSSNSLGSLESNTVRADIPAGPVGPQPAGCPSPSPGSCPSPGPAAMHDREDIERVSLKAVGDREDIERV